MKGLYLILDLSTVFFPLVLSFDKRVHFFRHWKATLLATLLVGIPFIIWDVIFTHRGYWGFNEDYLIGWELFELPIEEILFFFVIPFACVFIYACVKHYFAKWKFMNFNFLIYLGVFALMSFIIWQENVGWYSVSVCGLTFVSLLYIGRKRKEYPFLPLTFLISLLPFLVVNGILTGSFIDAPIVWYSEEQFSSIRLFTIPIEDILYSWNLIALNCLIFDWIGKGPNPSEK